MLLKKLELQGYKTFASRTEFPFESGITAVVGPNGSGKSNIADAIRWVLGEQSYSLLRGKKTEDMIFSGTQKRGRSGLAQATILLDNDDGHLPVAFSEVAITRRAYRSGENEYLLNGSRVRLRDINELLAASGLGQRTYNVIGQGLVDAALSLRADERRKLFEEAAGIALYKERREDALAKLDDTQRNLERVEDILSEVRPRMRRLERQAVRSREYDQVSRDLESLLYVWYGYRWEVAKQTLRTARAEAKQSAEALGGVRDAQMELEAETSALRVEASDLRGRLSGLQVEQDRVHGDAELLQRNLAVHTERSRLLEQQQSELEAETESLRRQSRPLAQQYDSAQRELERVDSIWERSKRAVERAVHELRIGREKASRLQEQLQQVQGSLLRLEAQSAVVDDRRVALAERQVTLAAEREAARSVLESERAERRTRQLDLDAVRERLASQSARLAELEAQEAVLQQRRRDAQHELEQLGYEAHQLRTVVTELDARRQALADLRQTGSGHEAAAQRLMTASDSPPGIVGPVVQLLRVPADLETAISAALGSELSTIVVEDRTAADKISVYWADQADAGRLSIVSLDDVQPPEPVSLHQNRRGELPGAHRLAADVIDCDDVHRPIVELLLNKVLLVKDRETARRIAPALSRGCRAVSLDGLVAHQDGRLTLPGGEPDSGLLSQERAWRELPTQREAACARRDAADARTAEAERALGQLGSESQQHNALVARVREQQETTGAERDSVLREVEKLSQSLSWRAEQLQRLENEEVTAQAEMSRLEESHCSLNEQLDSLRSQSSDLSAQLTGIPLDSLAQSLAAEERVLAQTEGMQRNQQTVSRTLGTAIQQLVDQRSAREDRAREVAEQRERLLSRIEKEHQEAQALASTTSELAGSIGPINTRLSEIDVQLDALLAKDDDLRRQTRGAEQISNQANLGLDRAKNDLDHLRERIRDELGLVRLPLDDDMEGQAPLPLGDIVGHLPVVTELPPDLDASIQRRRQQLRRMGSINPDAPAEFAELQERHSFLTSQTRDLREADSKMRQVILELDALMERDLRQTFDAVAAEFSKAFTRLFGGGSARLILTDPTDPVQSGVEIVARPPGRRQQGLALLSGGERSLTAAALIFALLKVSPTPFCVLDEVDAMLDEANVGRFREMLVELSEKTQFIVITHNRGTIQSADTIYGISMGTDGASQVISLRLEGEGLATPELK